MSEEKLTLLEKLAKIRATVEIVAKDKSGFNYKYTDINEILPKITAGMKKYDLSLIPHIVPGTTKVEPTVIKKAKCDKQGIMREEMRTEMLVTADMVFTWVNNTDSNDKLDVPWTLVGSQEDPSQGFGSALTYCTRYFLSNYFQMTQDNDVDAFRSKQKEAEQAEDISIAAEIIKTFDEELKLFLSENRDKAEDIKEFISRYVKKADYFAIKEPALAGKLLNDFRNKYINKEEKEKK